MPATSADRLNAISTELAALLEARVIELTTAMKAAEHATRQIVATEMEIARYKQIADQLGGEAATLQKEAASHRKRAEDARGAYASASEERDTLRSAIGRLEDDAEAVRRETADLKARIRGIEDTSARMRKLREDAAKELAAAERGFGARSLDKD